MDGKLSSSSASRAQLPPTPEKTEALVRGAVNPGDLELILSNIGVQPSFSSIYTSHAGPHTATVQVALKEGHRIGSYEYMAHMRRGSAARNAPLERLIAGP
jgi:hypothetical protein